MRQDFIIIIGAGLASVLAFALALTGSVLMLFSYFALLPLMMIGLRLGPSPVSLAATAGSAAILFIGGLPAFLIYSVTVALPSMMTMRVALQPKPAQAGQQPELCGLGEVLTALSLTGLVVIVVTSAVLSYAGTGLLIVVDEAVNFMLDSALPGAQANSEVFASIIAYVPAMAVASWVLMAVVNLLIAPSLAAKLGPILRGRPTIINVTLPSWLPGVLAAAVLGAFILEGEAGFVAENAIIVLAIPFLGLGLSVVHRFAAKYPFKRPALIVFYVVAMLSVWAPFLVAALGIVEHFLQSRPRFAGRDD